MNAQIKTILLTVLTLSLFVIALVELSGVSSKAIFNKNQIDLADHKLHQHAEAKEKMRTAPDVPRTTIAFEDTQHDFGVITDGEVVSHTYRFTYTGKHPLIIRDAVASCGCTVPSYPKEPVAPGASGEIVVSFNSKGRVGLQQKNVMIYSNAQQDAMANGFKVELKED